MFKSIKDLFSNNQKYDVNSVKRIVFDTDCKIRVSGFFKISHELVSNREDKEKVQDAVGQELLRKKDFGYMVSRTRQAEVKVISIGNEANGLCTVHFELTTHFYNSYIAIDPLSAKAKAKDYFTYQTEVPYYVNNIEKSGYDVEIDIITTGSKEVVFFEGEIGYEDNE
ncbi:hypothetical protein [Psychrobacter sp. PG1]|uniref:hypothetical protein n=1 Tax=unclassified Psychrobacter TaxID=196806 RepID=UPI001865DD8D|nr:hypothetical protein [Psychrobacter sp. PG1]